MGQKVNPNGMRLGINKDWDSKWFANKKDYAKFYNILRKYQKILKEDFIK